MLRASVTAIADPAPANQLILFRVKTALFQLRRSLINVFQPVQRYRPAADRTEAAVIAQSVTPLWTPHEAIERSLIAGKIHNLRIAARAIHGIEIPADSVFSFWAQIGRPTAAKGYVSGRELRQGCVIPSIGGGLCQLSNALYSAALDANLTIVERHAHTQIIPGSLAEIGRDATVFWNYVDLRFRTVAPLRIEVTLTQDALVVQFKSHPSPQQTQPADSSIASASTASAFRPIAKAKSCQTCGVTECSRSVKQPPPQETAVAYVLDEYWSEFDQYIQQNRKPGDRIAVPLNGKPWRKSNYAWNLTGFDRITQAYPVTLHRSIACRRLPAQGQSRQHTLLKFDRQLARFYAAQLDYKNLHCVVMQNLLPFLWQDGHLGGRRFDVLMTRLPLFLLQQRLDQAQQNHPESSTLNDFRVDRALLEAEQQALASARFLITPHSEIAALFPDKTVLLSWQLPAIEPPAPGKTILFPAATLGRKGAYELRQVAQNLGLTLRVWGPDLEGENFWAGVSIERSCSEKRSRRNSSALSADPLTGVGLVVLPAYVEHRPRLLLRAIAAGIPVIASEACGLGSVSGVTPIPTGDAIALQQAILRQFKP